eukprot:scaffold139159_cov21-Tisochrysis_lutea.AAC.1
MSHHAAPRGCKGGRLATPRGFRDQALMIDLLDFVCPWRHAASPTEVDTVHSAPNGFTMQVQMLAECGLQAIGVHVRVGLQQRKREKENIPYHAHGNPTEPHLAAPCRPDDQLRILAHAALHPPPAPQLQSRGEA